jgi:hypothetical protein
MELDRKLWLTADKSKVVEDGDPDAAFLLGTPGTVVPDDEAERLGLTGKPKAAEKQTAAPANKARKAASNK